MRAIVEESLRFFIVGLHRTGTTITAVIMDSLENGTCFGEPHWYAHTNDTKYDFFDDTDCSSDLCGYKETYKFPDDERPFCDALIERHLPLVDFFIVTFRNPVLVHSSMRNWAMDYISTGVILDGYRTMDKLVSHNKGVAIVLEDMIDGGVDYLSSRLPFEIEGDLVLDTDRSHHKMGDSRAIIESSGLEHTERRILINKRKIREHEEAIAIWKKHSL